MTWREARLASAFAMGALDIAALAANAGSFGLLWAYRKGDAIMRSAWICTRNYLLGNRGGFLPHLVCSEPAPAGPTSSLP